MAIAVCVAVIFLNKNDQGSAAEIYVDGELVRTVSLDEDCVFEIKTDYGVNEIQVKDGEIRVSSSDCKNQVCVESGWSSSRGKPIICAPHRLTVKITEKGESDLAV